MNHYLLVLTVAASIGLVACNKPSVVAVPAPVPGPAGPAGPAGNQGNQGNDGAKGETGKTGDSSTVIVAPAQPTTTPATTPETAPKQ
jgi:hypothetical protein